MEESNHEIQIKQETVSEFNNEQGSKRHGAQFKAVDNDLLDFHNLHRKNERVYCKSCHCRNTSCKCCFRPSHKISSLNIYTPSKCAGCCKILINGEKQCVDDSNFDKCRILEAGIGKPGGIRISDDVLFFHHIARGKNSTFSCVSCLSRIKRCKCCIRPATAVSNLNFATSTKCAGCLSYIQNGKKVCSDQHQRIECRILENTQAIRKRKFDKSFSKYDTMTSPHVRARRTSAKSITSIVSVPGETNSSTGLQTVSDSTAGGDSVSDTRLLHEATNLSTKQLSDMNSELLKQINKQQKTIDRLGFKNTQAIKKIEFLEEQLRDATTFMENV